MLQASNISLQVKQKVILNDVSITLEPGTFTALVGPNGAGKSSLLKVMAQEHTHYRGDVILNGRHAKVYKPLELSRVRAVLPQCTTVYFSFSVQQIVMLGRHGYRHSKKENGRIVHEVMNLTGIEHLEDRNYLTLSGGEKQRVQLARVLAQVWEETVFPRYILLDEPTASLDIAQQQNMFSLAKRMCERNIGVMAIIHDLNQAIQFADQLYFLRDGQVTSGGKAREVFTKSNIEETFCCKVNVFSDPCNKCPYIIPQPDDKAPFEMMAPGRQTQVQQNLTSIT
ncbi:MAG TPA: heme ABC transporter ATP-binding protein [Ohtaekwangia sp.]|nr:heme ABC transporter ATP-binding protein [Ohtaekwangia sp.]